MREAIRLTMFVLQLLPEYQVAHERAVYKTVAIVADTKKIVQNINLESLAELRAMQKPSIEIEDLMAAIIMICEWLPWFHWLAGHCVYIYLYLLPWVTCKIIIKNHGSSSS